MELVTVAAAWEDPELRPLGNDSAMETWMWHRASYCRMVPGDETFSGTQEEADP